MMVIDVSAAVAIIQKEPGYESVADRMVADELRFMSPVSAVETAMALARRYAEPSSVVDAYFHTAHIQIKDIDAAQAEWARKAFLLFGKGRHPARLNLGDCFSYAAAKALNAPLLFVGEDFSKTDILIA
ncbi:MAG TPA: type II toxin-antitoxin system VapC family toxin [Rhizomicrobium sp.]|jgi:ribonuclease VapC|nr:type II toxin-antitoxin system VapC family toxin [Rhizomicrobium sp.]